MMEESKRHGTVYEIAFRLEAIRRGLDVYPSEGDYSVVDCVVLGPSGRAHRVQVKGTGGSASDGSKNKYRITAGRGTAKEPLRATEVDVLACYISPKDTWYLIPMSVAHGRKSFAFWVSEGSTSQWEQYRNEWGIFLQ